MHIFGAHIGESSTSPMVKRNDAFTSIYYYRYL